MWQVMRFIKFSVCLESPVLCAGVSSSLLFLWLGAGGGLAIYRLQVKLYIKSPR